MAPQKMLYIKEEDKDLVDKAQLCSGENFSNTVMNALRFYVDSQEDADVDLQKLVIGFDPMTLDREVVFDFLSSNPEVFEKWQDILSDYEDDLENDYYSLICELLLDYLIITFYETQVTFFGKKLLADEDVFVSVYNLQGVEISQNLIEKSL
jgi:hypothetical protein